MTIDIDFREDGLSLLLPQFEDSKELKNILGALLTPLNDTLTGINQFEEGFDLRTAVGHQLDLLGKLLNVSRNERTDEDYRAAIKARILINNATGSGANFIRLLKLVLEDIEFSVIESFPATVQVVIYSPQNVIDEQLVNDITPVGVKGIFFENPYEGKTLFEFGEVQEDGSVVGGTVVPNVAELSTTDIVMANVIYQS